MAILSARIKARWSRMFAKKPPLPWERRAAAQLLYDVSKDAWACQMIADLLELEGDPGESMADYVSQMLRQPHRDETIAEATRSLERIDRGNAP